MKLSIFGIMTVMLVVLSTPTMACDVDDKLCVMEEIRKTADEISDKSWRDKVLRELAKSYTTEGHESKAIALIKDIEKPDTKAMTIRGIGMAAADAKWRANNKRDRARYKKLFDKLAVEANKIDHPASSGIAFTYIAMSQAFARDDAGAMATARAMENPALRHKAFAETAEIQAGRRDFGAAMASIAEIESMSFRNKAYGTVARIFTKRGELKSAYDSANKINNPYMRAQVLQSIINYDNKEETSAPPAPSDAALGASE